jgi:ribose 1,5-bisphosphokinase
VVTRPSDASEDHDSLSEPAFRFRADSGDFALWWEANGLLYGLPATVRDDLSRGCIVVANISRDVIARVRESFPRALIIHITATVDVLSKRLASRGREDEPERSERLSRSLLREQTVEADIRIENNGALADAGARFIATLTALASPAAR